MYSVELIIEVIKLYAQIAILNKRLDLALAIANNTYTKGVQKVDK